MRCFLGGLTPHGFKSFFEYTKNREYYGYILKGGPGTGKSMLMKRLAGAVDFGCDEYYCSSDINSLDAVVFPRQRMFVADGTAPHIMEPMLPALSGEIVNLGEFWNGGEIKSHARVLEYCFAENAGFHKRAARFTAAAGELFGNLRDCAEECMLSEKLSAFASRLAAKYLSGRGAGASYEIAQLSAITSSGYVRFGCDDEYTVVTLADDYFAASAELLRILAAYAEKKNYAVRVSFCNALPSPSPEAIVIPEKKLAFFASGFLCKSSEKAERKINMLRFYDNARLSEKKQRLSFDKSAGIELYDEAASSLGGALRVHNEIEKRYIAAMDFSRADEVFERILGEISAVKP